MTPSMTSTITELRENVSNLAGEILKDSRIAEIQKLLLALNPLEDLVGQPRTTIGSLLNFGLPATSEVSVRGLITVQPDEFYGLEGLVAAKKYLKKPGKAVPFAEIVAAIRAGGGDPGDEEKLKVSLARSTWDIAKIGADHFGLLEFYPHVKRGGKKKGGNAQDVPKPDTKDAPVTGASDLKADEEAAASQSEATKE